MTAAPAAAILIVAKRTRSETVALTPDQENQFIRDLEERGQEQVRSDLDHGKISPSVTYVASRWLAEREREAERRREASNSEQIELMRRASAAAEAQATEARRANTRATIALVMAIISIIVSAIGIWLPYWEAHK